MIAPFVIIGRPEFLHVDIVLSHERPKRSSLFLRYLRGLRDIAAAGSENVLQIITLEL